MEEEVKKTDEQKEPAPKKEIKLTTSILFMLFAIVSLVLLVITKICASFGVMSGVFYGIMSILIYVLPFVGLVLSYLGAKKLCLEFWANLGVLGIALLVMPMGV